MPRGARLWAVLIGTGLAVEAYGLTRDDQYTASSLLRWAFSTHHPHGRRAFTGCVVSGAAILIPHINKTLAAPTTPGT